MRLAVPVLLCLTLSWSEAHAQNVTIQLIPATTKCSPSGGFVYCFDTGVAAVGPLTIGPYSRTMYLESADVAAHFYGPGKPGCGPVDVKLVISVLPPLSLGGHLRLEAVTIGRPGSTELCVGLGLVGVGGPPGGVVSMTSPDLSAFRGLGWTHPSLASQNFIMLQMP